MDVTDSASLLYGSVRIYAAVNSLTMTMGVAEPSRGGGIAALVNGAHIVDAAAEGPVRLQFADADEPQVVAVAEAAFG